MQSAQALSIKVTDFKDNILLLGKDVADQVPRSRRVTSVAVGSITQIRLSGKMLPEWGCTKFKTHPLGAIAVCARTVHVATVRGSK